MKKMIVIVAMFTLAAASNAGIVGWLTSGALDWQSVQRTGGIRIGAPLENDRKKLLPIEYDLSGQTAVTRKPEAGESGRVVRKVEAVVRDRKIVIRVITQLVEKTSKSGSNHFADLSEIPTGSYEVFYGIAGDPERHLGRIEIK